MDVVGNWLDSFKAIVSGHIDVVLAYLPSLLGAIVLLALGWLVAVLARFAVRRCAQFINDFFERVLSQGVAAGVQMSSRSLRVVETVVYWIVVLFFVAKAASLARLNTIAAWLDALVGYLPSIVGGGVIIFLGYIISTVVRDVIAASLSNTQVSNVTVPAMCAQGATLLVAVVFGIEQVGIDSAFLVMLISILIGGGLLSLAVAFGLGASPLVSNLIGAHDLRQYYEAGQAVNIAGVDGVILEINATNVVLDTAGGRIIVPAKVFHEQNTTLVVPEA